MERLQPVIMDDQLTPEEIDALMHEAGLLSPASADEAARLARTTADQLTRDLDGLNKSPFLDNPDSKDGERVLNEMIRLRKRIAFLRQQIEDFEHQAGRRN